jgi:hypothetical protein
MEPPAAVPNFEFYAAPDPAFAYDYPPHDFVAGSDVGSPARPFSTGSTQSGFGHSEAIALLLALSGLAFVASAFGTWGRVREAAYVAGNDLTFSATFPGVGSPSQRGRVSDGTGTLEVIPTDSLSNTNPGWIALALGVLLLAAGVAYYLAWNRKAVGAVAAALSVAGLIVCIGYLIDVRGAFDDPMGLANFEFSPGLGLISATALAAFATVLGSAAFIVEQRSMSASR